MNGADLRLANDAVNRLETKLGRDRLISYPVEVVIEPTNECNGRCLMCLPFRRDKSLPHPATGFMDMRTLHALAPALTRARRVLLGGFGEPLLHPEYLKMLRWVKQRAPYVYLFTNGTLLSCHLAEGLVHAEMDVVVVSIGGATESTCRHVRGVPFELVRQGLENLARAKSTGDASRPEVRFNVVQMNSVLPEMRAIVDLARQFGVSRIAMPQMWVESAAAVEESVLGNADAPKVLDEVRRYAQGRGVEIRIEDLPPSKHECRTAWANLIVGFDGEVYSCSGERYRMGSVNEQPVVPMWRSGSFKTLRSMLRADARSLCPHCPIIEPDAFTNPALHGRFVSEAFDTLSGPPRVRDERVCDAASGEMTA